MFISISYACVFYWYGQLVGHNPYRLKNIMKYRFILNVITVQLNL